MEISQIMFALLRFELNQTELSENVKNAVTPEILPALYKLSKRHDLVHLIGDALVRNGFLTKGTEEYKRFQKERSVAVYRYEQQCYELEGISRIFEAEKIEYVLLKGAVLRSYYPEAWMRTSGDIDILVQEKELERAERVLTEKLGFTSEGKYTHDMQLFSPNGVHLELHYRLIEKQRNQKASKVLSEVWEHTVPTLNSGRREMTDAMFYFYHIVHMSKHFNGGGCGIRPFLDLYILKKKELPDMEVRQELLKRAGLEVFAREAGFLADVWLNNAEHTELSKQLETFILQGGVYGSTQNGKAVQQGKKGKFKYIMSRIFTSYEYLRSLYPVLQKHKWLYPFCQVRRWFRLIFIRGRAKDSFRELKEVSTAPNEQTAAMRDLLKELGL